MEFFTITYLTHDINNTYGEHRYHIGILGNSKQDVEDFLRKNVQNFKKIESNSKSARSCTAITDSIISRILDTYNVERPTQNELHSIKQYYQDKLESLENTNRELQLKLDKLQQSNNDIDDNDVWDIL